MLEIFQSLWPDFDALWQWQGDGLTALFVVILFLIFLSSSLYIFIQYRRSKKSVKSLDELFGKYQTLDIYEEKYAFEQDIEAISSDNSKRLLREYKATLIHSPKTQKIYGGLAADYFFNTNTLASGITKNRLLIAVPSILVAMGVLGTFVGLTSGLRGLDIHSDEIEVLKDGIGQLVAGVSLAFMTSIWGVGLSLLLNFYEKMSAGRIEIQILRLNDKIEQIFPQASPERALQSISDNSEESKDALLELHEKLGSTMQEAVKGLSKDFEEAITSALNNVMKPAIETLVTTTQDQSSHALEGLVTQFTEGMREAGMQQESQLREAGEVVNKATMQMGIELKEFIDVQKAQTERLSKQEGERQVLIDGQLNRLRDQYEGFLSAATDSEKSNQEASQALLTQQEEILTHLTQVTEAMRKSGQNLDNSSNQLGILSGNLKQLTDTFSGTLASIGNTINSASERNEEVANLLSDQLQSLDGVTQALRDSGETLGKSAELARDGFTQLEMHQTTFLAGMKREFNDVSTHLTDEVESLQKTVSQWLADYNEQVTTQISDRFKEWNDETTRFATSMHSTVSAIAALVDEIESKTKRNRS